MPVANERNTRTTRRREARPLRRSKNAEPISAQIFATLRQRILDNEYAKSGSLPPELELVKEFRVSRYTVRSALQKLVIDGFIERRRGTGTTIVQRDSQPGTWSVGSLDQMLGAASPGEVLFAGAVPGNRFPKVARLFGIGADESLFQVIRLIQSPRGPLSYSTVFTRLEFGNRVPKQDLPSQFFLTLLEEHCGLRAVRARQVASAAIPPPAAQRALGLGENDPALVLQRTFLTRSGEPIEHVEMYCHADLYAQIVDFYREDEISSASTTRSRSKQKQ
jgi:GntR family transcriptional regulator